MTARLAIALLLLGAANEAGATERRVALLVAHPFGGEGLTPLRYVGHDVELVLTQDPTKNGQEGDPSSCRPDC